MEKGAGFLETPTYVLCVVFFIFLLMSVAFEKILHWLKHYFEKNGMQGLLHATNDMVMELALMAFFSLFILISESVLSDLCVPEYEGTFMLLQKLMQNCHDCLKTTKTIDMPYECTVDNNISDDIHLLASQEGIKCKEGEQHLISIAALRHIHIFIFLLAVCHIGSAMVIIVLASWRMRFWRRVSNCDDLLSEVVQEKIHEYHDTVEQVASGSLDQNIENNTKYINHMPSTVVFNYEQHMKSTHKRHYISYRAGVWFKCFLAQFYRNVRSDEFILMRENFAFTHKLGKTFQFTEYLLRVMEYDFKQVTGIGLTYWLALIVIVLVSGLFGWMDFISEIVGIVIVLIVNTVLIRVLFEVTCTGELVNLQKLETRFWFNRPAFLLQLIQCAIFLNTIGFSSIAFFAWQFGYHSCYFEGVGFSILNVPWWVCLIMNVILLLDLGLVTLPLYTVAAQMNSGARWQAHLLPQGVQGKLANALKKVRAKPTCNASETAKTQEEPIRHTKSDNSTSSTSSEKIQVQMEELENTLIESYYGDVEGKNLLRAQKVTSSLRGQKPEQNPPANSYSIQIGNDDENTNLQQQNQQTEKKTEIS
eukprot:TRINITY_DN288_c0_g1_i5.p1 TRINITY_DN288_c0_g1~~TRINITY_DN288_c0_g1_i5.p1  ORF type:complete len:590 (+),score=51.44 TRINITY_DN288_c0_g1_i5:103-1872(+)